MNRLHSKLNNELNDELNDGLDDDMNDGSFDEIIRSVEKRKNVIGETFLIRFQDGWKKKRIAIDDMIFGRIAILIENESNDIDKDFRMKEGRENECIWIYIMMKEELLYLQ
jgi:hypothetical protein